MRTVGVEEELLLVDPDSGEPRAQQSAVLARAAQDDPGQDVFQKELFGQMLEFATHPQTDMADLGAEIVHCRKEAARLAGEIGCAVAALATSPLPVTPTIVAHERYRWMTGQYGMTAQEQLICGCHAHVSVASDEEGVAVLDRIRPWLPVLCALSANSPFWHGRDTGYVSYRSRVQRRWPQTGPNELFGSAERYHRLVRDMLASGVVLDSGMLYFDARLSARYPTVELRVADVCLRAETTVLVATLARALVETAARDWRAGRPPLDHSVNLLKLAGWQAARSGLGQDLLDPVTMLPRPAVEVLGSLLEHTGDALADSGDAAFVAEAVAELLRRGNGAHEQRLLMERTGSLRHVVTECVRRTQD
ncbi:carboxylate-amine ligase [Streptomyces griseochromogenes]|uniref:Putative glutamate--cysteine ligase 2 n=1 Tax=Streptomyces griseochromogenes TaxID=68214 RepID=A0A1B1B1K9_9ACTN|nr:glutamate--cysteine ligase [Streptomyces griseochromogenes]ANP52718.1 carboxylate--amine ligase [Streptomyces griseochromogenes]MBP2047325.1 carboxylate-amine ligase [Streptomyces griseochromogenes]